LPNVPVNTVFPPSTPAGQPSFLPSLNVPSFVFVVVGNYSHANRALSTTTSRFSSLQVTPNTKGRSPSTPPFSFGLTKTFFFFWSPCFQLMDVVSKAFLLRHFFPLSTAVLSPRGFNPQQRAAPSPAPLVTVCSLLRTLFSLHPLMLFRFTFPPPSRLRFFDPFPVLSDFVSFFFDSCHSFFPIRLFFQAAFFYFGSCPWSLPPGGSSPMPPPPRGFSR